MPQILQKSLTDPTVAADVANIRSGRLTPEQDVAMQRARLQQRDPYTTALTRGEESQFQTWKTQYAPRDSGADYDLRGAFKAGLTPDPQTGHWPDTFKKPNHPTFSNESMYAVGADAAKAGYWTGPNRDQFVSPGQLPPSPAQAGFVRPTNTSDREADLLMLLHQMPSKYGNLGRPAPPPPPVQPTPPSTAPGMQGLIPQDAQIGSYTPEAATRAAIARPPVQRSISLAVGLGGGDIGPEGFYSHAENVLNESKQGIFQGQQLLGYLKAKGVKDEELEWSGLRALSQNAKVTKQEALDTLARAPRVGEQILTAKPEAAVGLENQYFQVNNRINQIQAQMERNSDPQLEEEFNQLYIQRANIETQMEDLGNKRTAQYNRSDLTLPGPHENYQEILLTHHEQELAAAPKFNPSHFQEPDVLAWLRLNNRYTGAEGYDVFDPVTGKNFETVPTRKEAVNSAVRHGSGGNAADYSQARGAKISHSDEYQSDWANAGRKEGFKDPEVEAARAEKDRLVAEHKQLFVKHGELLRDPRPWEQVHPELDPIRKRSDEIIARLNEIKPTYMRPGSGSVERAPFVEGSWPDLVAKRHLLEAARDPDVAHVTWTTGQQQTDRYGLDKHFSEIRYDPQTQILNAWDKSIGPLNRDLNSAKVAKAVRPEELPDHIGPELTNKLLASKPKDYSVVYHKGSGSGGSNIHSLEGDDLKYMDEGKRTFYDKIMPQTFKRLTKQEPRQIDIQGEEHLHEGITNPQGQKVWSIPMTPELRAKILGSDSSSLAISKMQQAGVLKPGMGLTEGGSLLDAKGGVHDLVGASHEQALMKANLMPQREPGYSDMATALKAHQLIRFRETPTEINVELGDNPTESQLMSLTNLFSRHPRKPIVIDAYKKGDILTPQRFDNGADALSALHKFYPSSASIKKIIGSGFPLYSIAPIVAHKMMRSILPPPPESK